MSDEKAYLCDEFRELPRENPYRIIEEVFNEAEDLPDGIRDEIESAYETIDEYAKLDSDPREMIQEVVDARRKLESSYSKLIEATEGDNLGAKLTEAYENTFYLLNELGRNQSTERGCDVPEEGLL